jgi:hypothetical protein
MKSRGGLPIQALKEPFAISYSNAYSIKLLESFDKQALL